MKCWWNWHQLTFRKDHILLVEKVYGLNCISLQRIPVRRTGARALVRDGLARRRLHRRRILRRTLLLRRERIPKCRYPSPDDHWSVSQFANGVWNVFKKAWHNVQRIQSEILPGLRNVEIYFISDFLHSLTSLLQNAITYFHFRDWIVDCDCTTRL